MFADDRIHVQIACGLAAPTAAVAMAMLLSLAGCSSDDDPPVAVSSSPALTAPPGGETAPSSSPASPRDAVIAAYRGYWDATIKAATVPVGQIRKTLEPYSTSPVIEDQIRGIRVLQAKNQEPWGKINLGISAVRVQGSTARLSDCQDTSNAGFADRRTHQLIPSTRGRARPYNLSATLQRGSDARWRVSSVRPVEKPCTLPAPSGA